MIHAKVLYINGVTFPYLYAFTFLQVFGIYDRETHVGFIQFVDNRDAATLLPIIQAHVLLGTMIYCDGWGAYNNLGQLGYGHEVVIHDQHFVDPVTGAHTNGVEAYWSRAKQKSKLFMAAGYT